MGAQEYDGREPARGIHLNSEQTGDLITVDIRDYSNGRRLLGFVEIDIEPDLEENPRINVTVSRIDEALTGPVNVHLR